MGDEGAFTNMIGMQFVKVEPGAFAMGNDTPLPDDLVRLPNRARGDFDERPVHRVSISRSFHFGAAPVTNAQYEQYDPKHSAVRGKLGYSNDDDEAVVFVSWNDAVGFCEWLTEREGRPYRLPTEAEWEYACRAGTDTPYSAADTLPEDHHRHQNVSWYPDEARSAPGDVVPLPTGRTAPNPWGLGDMHGLVEEWCSDWYGPYEGADQTDPTGPSSGDFRVTRGGSHSTELYYLRSANRMGTLPDERSWIVGFRVVAGEPPAPSQTMPSPVQLHQRNVTQVIASKPREHTAKPFFSGPRVYVRISPDADGPMFATHNHVPALASCPNGDLLAAWYTCREEPGREVATIGARLRRNVETGAFHDRWDRPSMFWDAPDRNDHASAMWCDESGTIWHFCGLSAAATWGNLATVVRTSSDNGATWSPARFIIPEHGPRHMPITTVFRAQDGTIVLPCDAVTGGSGGTALWLSRDNGATWNDAGGTIAGIHAAVAQLADGRLVAFGRGDEVHGMMPLSISQDMGRSWSVQAAVFPPVHTGQRPVLLKLRTGELLFATFSNDPDVEDDPHRPKDWMRITDCDGVSRPIRGLYCALSLDDGATWPFVRPVSDDGPERLIETMDGGSRPMSRSESEHAGYLSCVQAEDGLVHLISSRNHYMFNVAWLRTRPPGLD